MIKRKELLFSLFTLVLFIFFIESTQAQSNTKQQYLADNHEILSFDKPNEFKFFDKNFYANDMFLLGEMHGTANSYRVQQMLADEFKKKTNFKYYLIEWDNASASEVNNIYLETGDESALKAFFESAKGDFSYSQEFYNVFTYVYQLNQNLSRKDRIKFIGAGVIHPGTKYIESLNKLLSDVKYKQGTSEILDEIYTYKKRKYVYEEKKKLFTTLNEEVKNNTQRFEKILGKNFWEFKFLVDNFAASFPINGKRSGKPISDEEVETIRDTQMAKNFAELYKHLNLKKQKIFGYFGREHTYQDNGKETQWMTSQIKKNNPTLKIASFSMRYMDCNFMIPTYFLEAQFGTKQEKLYFFGTYQNDNSPFVKAVGIDDLNTVEPSAEAILFKMNGKNSPYNSLPDLVEEIAKDKATTNYFDYAILLRKSKAATPNQ
jgi:hypothetical protein